MYESNNEGKRSYVNDLLKPMLLFTGLGIINVEYLDDTSEKTRMYPETVLITNANPAKTISVNVSGDSIGSLVCDVMKKLFGLDYAREREEDKV